MRRRSSSDPKENEFSDFESLINKTGPNINFKVFRNNSIKPTEIEKSNFRIKLEDKLKTEVI